MDRRLCITSLLLATILTGCTSPQPRREVRRSAPTAKRQAPRIQRNAFDNWYTGGTLHKLKMRDWYRATTANQVATCADLAAAMSVNEGEAIRDMEHLKRETLELLACINEAGRGGVADNLDITEICAACRILMRE